MFPSGEPASLLVSPVQLKDILLELGTRKRFSGRRLSGSLATMVATATVVLQPF
jgi:hypothetical protein